MAGGCWPSGSGFQKKRMDRSEMKEHVTAYPIRVIPFDLGRQLTNADVQAIQRTVLEQFQEKDLTPRQESIIKGCCAAFKINDKVEMYVFENGLCVSVIQESPVSFGDRYQEFSVLYCENRKIAHSQLFKWAHPESSVLDATIADLRAIVRAGSKHERELRKSANAEFENRGLSYIMTLSMFEIDKDLMNGEDFRNFPGWLKRNIYALMDPALLYLEDSSKFSTASASGFDISKILNSLESGEELHDFERHRHLNTYMSWAAVVLVGQIQNTDREEYIALEVQLQCDWFYIYCLDKNLGMPSKITRREIIDLQRQNYELELLEDRLLDFNDSSMPSRILEIQRGLVDTSGLADNIQRLRRKIKYLLDREQLEVGIRQRRLGQSSELLLFFIAVIEIAPIVAEYGDHLFPHAGILINIAIIVLGILLLIWKN